MEPKRILTVGTPVHRADEIPGEGWTLAKCEYCKGDMYCLEGNDKAKEGEELVLICMECMTKGMADIPDGSMDHINGDMIPPEFVAEPDPWGDNFQWN